MTERGMQIKADSNKASWESSEFPILCETCLGENPFLRMMRMPHGKACKTCERPFTNFRWQPGPRARYKSTQICQTCAKAKNVCQTCVLDLVYGLPVEVRDAYLAKAGGAAASLVPRSDVMREYQAQQQRKEEAEGTLTDRHEEINAELLRLARKTPNYKRNLAHICSFYAKGECTRGSSCPYRHEMPYSRDDPLSKQKITDRFHGKDDPVAAKMLARAATMQKLKEPDKDATTLWVSGVDAESGITQEDIKGAFYTFGELKGIRMVPQNGCAFVDFATHEQAAAAANALFGLLNLRGKQLHLNWANKPRVGGGGGHGAGLGPGAAPRGGARAAAAGGAAAGAASAGAAAPKALAPGWSMVGGFALPPPPGYKPGMKTPALPAALTAFPAGAKSGPVRPAQHRRAAPYYPSMDPGAMGARIART